ncbi:hypothetical protein [Selenihalanaerobacter shriftii]|uniref:Uncharacterized protein n=1 Tax=Selenihalanaerobacter shriftii TaxID=142842 RepID=A0A1T4K943_9FIRM|nr:hypothetical protein [Selenihalanaerobacter shriftii]SJZ38954.1 hypothetical protein SAMN02745118_00698 [Selenihalanaerobacter shriftii]
MFQCKSCGVLIEKLRPKFIDVIVEGESKTPPNVKEYLCPECGGVNYILNLEYCDKCKYSDSFLEDPQTGRVIATGCRGKCLNNGFKRINK